MKAARPFRFLLGVALALAWLGCDAGDPPSASPHAEPVTTKAASESAPRHPQPCLVPPVAPPAACVPPPSNASADPVFTACMANFLEQGGYCAWQHDLFPRTGNKRMTGPLLQGTSYQTHSRATVYYSDEVVNWLRAGRVGAIPDGATIVKEMYVGDPSTPMPTLDEVQGWTVMVKNAAGSKDGWVWVIDFRAGNATNNIGFLGVQQGMSFCLACHAATDTDQLTFASLGNLDGTGVRTYSFSDWPAPLLGELHAGTIPRDEAHASFVAQRARTSERSSSQGACASPRPSGQPGSPWNLPDPLPVPNPDTLRQFPGRTLPPNEDALQWIPTDYFCDHVPQPPTRDATFLSGDVCSGCHDAAQMAGNSLPHMMVERADGSQFNLSPWGEWSASMMGLAGRDPVFYAQLESEMALRPESSDLIQDFCTRCHAVQGNRQLHAERGAEVPFTKAMLYAEPDDPDGRFGALGRAGVACTTCHHITSEGLGTSASWNAGFKTGPPNEVYGPFADDLKPRLMEMGLGIAPVHGAQIGDSALCGSCHTVVPPKLPLGGGPQEGTAHEQTTYLEWLNSAFNDTVPQPGPHAQSCADCHMPDSFYLEPGEKLAFPIANIEDGNFPQVDHRAPYEEITLAPRSPFRRHTLVGINTFVMQMFQQFPNVLGHFVFDAAAPLPSASVFPVPRLKLAGDEAVRMIERSAQVIVRPQGSSDGILRLTVMVENLTGHKFPTGVGFRRAFLQVTAFDAADNVMWQSGRMNRAGVLVDPQGNPLPSEFTRDPAEILPYQRTFSRETQVQVYEQRHSNNLGQLTTSFVGLFNEEKDTRINPQGWSIDGPFADVTQPVQKGREPMPGVLAGYDRIFYRIPARDLPAPVAKVRAALYYQSIPPGYLRDRFETPGPENDRLYYLVNYLNLAGTPMDGWALLVDDMELVDDAGTWVQAE